MTIVGRPRVLRSRPAGAPGDGVPGDGVPAARRWASGRVRLLAVVVVAAVCWPLATALLTVRLTVQRPGFYESALDRSDAYERVYTEILTDPRVTDVTNQLLAGLSVDESVVSDNLRVVVPPSALRGVATSLAGQVSGYLAGENIPPRATIDLRPVLANVSELADSYLAGAVARAGHYQVDDVSAVIVGVLDALSAVARGQPPRSLPAVSLTPDQADAVARAVEGALPAAERGRLDAPLRAALVAGDLTAAVAIAGPPLFRGDERSIAGLRARLGGGTQLDLGGTVAPRLSPELRGGVGGLHQVGSFGVVALAGGLIALMMATIVAAARPAGPTRSGEADGARSGNAGSGGDGSGGGGSGNARSGNARWGGAAAGSAGAEPAGAGSAGADPVPPSPPSPRRARLVVAALAAAGASAFAVGLALTLVIGNPLAGLSGPGSPLPPSAARLIGDIGGNLIGETRRTWLWLAAAPPLVALALVATGAVLTGFVRSSQRRRRLLVTAGTSLAGLSALWIVVPTPVASTVTTCNGASALCRRAYPDVTYAAAHNAMASTDARFFGATQDLDMIGQLDAGVRALLIDVHLWTPPAELASFLAGLPPAQRDALRPWISAAASHRDGLWLCHDACQLGALPLVGQLEKIRAWLAENPSEVVTLIIQDGAPAPEVMSAFQAAGLGRYLATPPAKRAGSWPTLGQMIESGHRLVVFAESADVPGTWYRNVFRYTLDTPFDVSSPSFGCALGRVAGEKGAGSAPMMILANHWVTRTAGSRAAAVTTNQAGSLLAQVQACERDQGRRPTFIAVNFTSIGDLVPTVEQINLAPPLPSPRSAPPEPSPTAQPTRP